MRLSQQALEKLNPGVRGVTYDRAKSQIGIVHMGPGAFHRGHQAVYTDKLLRAGATEMAISAISVNSSGLRDALAPQDNLYTLAILDKTPSYEIIGAIKEILVAAQATQMVIDRMSDPRVKAVTMTITEKGYCLTPEGRLDINNDYIQHDLANPQNPRSAIGLLLAALRVRRKNNDSPFIPISCDNLTNNGQRLHQGLSDLSHEWDEDFGRWIDAEVRCPSTMVDSITPATQEQCKDVIARAIGVRDEWPVQREAFTQWVIEDLPGQKLPPWADVGATVSNNVQAFEMAKLRVLNGLHTTLTFVGIYAGYRTVGEVVNVKYIRNYLWDTFEEEIAPNLPNVPGLDLAHYANQILERFENPSIAYTLEQIAGDSSQKIPVRILGSIRDNLSRGKSSPRLSLAVAGWMRFVSMKVNAGESLTDPLAKKLVMLINDGKALKSEELVNRFCDLGEVFPGELADNPQFRREVARMHGQFVEGLTLESMIDQVNQES